MPKFDRPHSTPAPWACAATLTTKRPAQRVRHLVVVDAALPDLPVLLAHLPVDAEVAHLHGAAPALQQIARAADGHRHLHSLHVLGHGESGRMWLGGQWLDAQALAAQPQELATLSAALADDAHIYLYGCHSAQGPAGQQWLDAWALATGAWVHGTEQVWALHSAGLHRHAPARSASMGHNPLVNAWQRSTWAHALNNAPTLNGIPSTTQAVVVGTPAALSHFAVADADGAGVTLNVTLTPTNGTLGNVTDANPGVAGIQLSGTAAAINLALYGATFNATAAGAASVGVSVSDGVAGAVTGTYNLTASAAGANTAPTFLSGTGKAIVPVGTGFDNGTRVIQ